MTDQELVRSLLKDYSDRIRRVEKTTDIDVRLYPLFTKYLHALYSKFVLSGTLLLVPDTEDCPYRWLHFWPDFSNDPYFFVDTWNFDGCHVYYSYRDKLTKWYGQYGVHVPFSCLSDEGVVAYYKKILTQLRDRYVRIREERLAQAESDRVVIETLSKHIGELSES